MDTSRRQGRGGASRALPALGAVLLTALLFGGTPAASGAPPAPLVLGLLGPAGPDLDAAADGARAALGGRGGGEPGAVLETLPDGGSPAGVAEAVRRLRGKKVAGLVALPTSELESDYRKAARSLRVPWIFTTSMVPDARPGVGAVRFLAPSPASQALAAADAMLAPLAARRVAVVHEPTERGRALAAVFLRNLSARIVVAGTREWSRDAGALQLEALRSLEVDRVYAAVTGSHADRFVAAMTASPWRPPCLFADGCRNPRWLAASADALMQSVFLDGPDAELTGREGERLAEALDRAGVPLDSAAVRAFEAARRLLAAAEAAGSARASRLEDALDAGSVGAGVLGRITEEPHGAARFFPHTLWRLKGSAFEPWPAALLPMPTCGPPLGFRVPEPAEIEERGKIGYLTYGEGEKRTIEADLLAVGLSTGGEAPEIDAFLRDEVLGRAIRIAHRLFRREADGSLLPGWSWGMTFTTKPPAEDLPRVRTWLAVVAGDHPAAGGQVIGAGMVAVYSTFLKRTMYEARRLDPPVSRADAPLLDGTYRWGEDRAANRRADEIRCLLDGFSSAVGLTLSHEFGHLCGCGHDTDHPTSIMNVVAGAGASWEEAVWIPSHAKSVATTLGLEGLAR